MQEFVEHECRGWPAPRGPAFVVGSWQRVLRWSFLNENPLSMVRVVDTGLMYVGSMRFVEFLGSRLALVAYYREDYSEESEP